MQVQLAVLQAALQAGVRSWVRPVSASAPCTSCHRRSPTANPVSQLFCKPKTLAPLASLPLLLGCSGQVVRGAPKDAGKKGKGAAVDDIFDGARAAGAEQVRVTPSLLAPACLPWPANRRLVLLAQRSGGWAWACRSAASSLPRVPALPSFASLWPWLVASPTLRACCPLLHCFSSLLHLLSSSSQWALRLSSPTGLLRGYVRRRGGGAGGALQGLQRRRAHAGGCAAWRLAAAGLRGCWRMGSGASRVGVLGAPSPSPACCWAEHGGPARGCSPQVAPPACSFLALRRRRGGGAAAAGGPAQAGAPRHQDCLLRQRRVHGWAPKQPLPACAARIAALCTPLLAQRTPACSSRRPSHAPPAARPHARPTQPPTCSCPAPCPRPQWMTASRAP